MPDWGIALAALVALAIVLGFLLMRRDREVSSTRWGFFVERDRYADADEPEPPVEETREWPRHDPPLS